MSASPEVDASMGDGTAAAQAPAPCVAAARSDWLAWRRGGVGASEAAAIVGLSPWASAWSVWAIKTGLVAEDEGNASMRLGTLLEPVLVKLFHEGTGLYVAGEQTWCTHPDEPWMRCTVDGFVMDHPDPMDAPWLDQCLDAMYNTLAIYEAKYTSEQPWDEVPAHYQCQVQWQMAVTGLDRVMLGVLHMPFGRPQYRVYTVERDEADIALLTDKARRFWFDHVLAGIAPPADGHRATTDALAHAWQADDDAKVAADVRLVDRVAKLAQLKAERKQVDADIELIENEIRAALGEATALVDGDRVLCTWREQTATRLDGKALKAAEPEVWEKYAVTTASRVLRLKGAA